MHSISIIGLGHVGLVNAVCFAHRGYRVIGIETDQNRLKQVRKADPPFFEPSLPDYLRDAIDRNLLLATDDFSLNAQADCCFIAVETPSKSDGSTDLGAIEAAASAVGRSLRDSPKNQLIVILSTVPPGTARNIITPILEKESCKAKGEGFNLCSNPELFQQGDAIHDTEYPDRIIIGGDEPDASRLERFYGEFCGDRRCVILRTTHENAELIKYANSAFIANKISFINFIADIAEKVHFADVRVIAEGIGLDERIGPGALHAGIGWGGPCLPKDTRALAEFSRRCGVESDLIRAVSAVNNAHHYKVIRLARETLGSLKENRIALLGLAFKSGTDEVKEASSIAIIKNLLAEGAQVVVYDPKSVTHARKVLGNEVEYADNAVACIEQTDCCIIATEWDEFKQIPPETFRRKMRRPIVIDGRGIYKVDAFSQAGIRLLGIGVGPTT